MTAQDNLSGRQFDPDDIDMTAVLRHLHGMEVPAHIEQTGGNTATLFAGDKVPHPYEPGEMVRPIAAGPGSYDDVGGRHVGYVGEFNYGRNQDFGDTDDGEWPQTNDPQHIARGIFQHVMRANDRRG
jgi:hypothetical protein